MSNQVWNVGKSLLSGHADPSVSHARNSRSKTAM
jgi:hypothetical protein